MINTSPISVFEVITAVSCIILCRGVILTVGVSTRVSSSQAVELDDAFACLLLCAPEWAYGGALGGPMVGPCAFLHLF